MAPLYNQLKAIYQQWSGATQTAPYYYPQGTPQPAYIPTVTTTSTSFSAPSAFMYTSPPGQAVFVNELLVMLPYLKMKARDIIFKRTINVKFEYMCYYLFRQGEKYYHQRNQNKFTISDFIDWLNAPESQNECFSTRVNISPTKINESLDSTKFYETLAYTSPNTNWEIIVISGMGGNYPNTVYAP